MPATKGQRGRWNVRAAADQRVITDLAWFLSSGNTTEGDAPAVSALGQFSLKWAREMTLFLSEKPRHKGSGLETACF